MADEHPPHPLDSLIVLFEATKQNLESSIECLLTTSALLETILAEWPTLEGPYIQARRNSAATAPVPLAAGLMLRQVDASLVEMKRKRGW